jgi:1-aminocyclopropane-1-carboxylate deaminase/D-cysteine desulfhydrase-like pyridoxal-dependent ACC family enzyme
VLPYSETPVQQIKSDFLTKARIKLIVKREDLNHPIVSGNKWWKLKYNLEEARNTGLQSLLTFGGAYSNHIYATAAAAKACGMRSTGIIRGEERPLNSTLAFATRQGMHLHYISREAYRKKTEPEFIENLKKNFGDFYLIPEGGTNEWAIKGCMEWAQQLQGIEFDYLCLPVGTGGTMAGLIAGLQRRNVIGFSVLKGDFLKNEVSRLTVDYTGKDFSNWRIETQYHFGGYAKSSSVLQDFIRIFERDHGVALDEIYTGKMMFGILDSIKQNKFERETTILALHTGGLQVFNKG